MITRLQILKILIVLGFLLNLANNSVNLVCIFTGDSKATLVLDETENSEKKEKETSEKDDQKEKDKISEFYDNNDSVLANIVVKKYPEHYVYNMSIYLDHITPPPQYNLV
ncbi:hypothetical protein [Aquimarina pacifica]|uniref:hypothetical protein n=1 Tax=Aquimarina pacifica TaxID=1296415 RepID=UPI00046EBD43|nr:hypothetical protein [Aquimarina pacifica]